MPLKISIVMPAYNRAYIIGHAIESVLAQTYTDWELIIVDDGSKDDTQAVIQQFPSDRIRYTRHECNRGYSAACNTGISLTTGDAVAFLDSDDRWDPKYLRLQVDFLLHHPDIGVVFCDVEVRYLDGRILLPSTVGIMPLFRKMLSAQGSRESYAFAARDTQICLLQEIPMKPSATIIRSEFLSFPEPFDEKWPSGTDWALFLRLARTVRFGFVSKTLVRMGRGEDATHQMFREKDQEFLLTVFRNEKSNSGDRELRQAANRGIARCCANLGFIYATTGRRAKAIATYLLGFKETGEIVMLARLLGSMVPLQMRERVKNLLRKKLLARA